jgi:hypothetical protein
VERSKMDEFLQAFFIDSITFWESSLPQSAMLAMALHNLKHGPCKHHQTETQINTTCPHILISSPEVMNYICDKGGHGFVIQ